MHHGRLEGRSQRRARSVHEHLAQIAEQLLGPVLGGPVLEQLRVLVDEVGVDRAREELLVLQHVQQEGDVGLTGGGGRSRGSITDSASGFSF